MDALISGHYFVRILKHPDMLGLSDIPYPDFGYPDIEYSLISGLRKLNYMVHLILLKNILLSAITTLHLVGSTLSTDDNYTSKYQLLRSYCTCKIPKCDKALNVTSYICDDFFVRRFLSVTSNYV